MTKLKRQPRGQRLVEIHLRLPLDLLENIEVEANGKQITLSAYIREILILWMERAKE